MPDTPSLSLRSLAGMIDHIFLKPFGTAQDIEKLCEETRRFNFVMVAINSAEVHTCSGLLQGSPVRVGAAIGFPLGQSTSAVKAYEIQDTSKAEPMRPTW
ncbi:MAG: hypothetical protein WCK35_22245 [Chloroflexota bacterium]